MLLKNAFCHLTCIYISLQKVKKIVKCVYLNARVLCFAFASLMVFFVSLWFLHTYLYTYLSVLLVEATKHYVVNKIKKYIYDSCYDLFEQTKINLKFKYLLHV